MPQHVSAFAQDAVDRAEDLANMPVEVRAAVAHLPPLVSTAQTLAWVGYSKPGWWKGIAEGRFPKPIKIGPNRVAWLRSDLAQWLAQRIAARPRAGATTNANEERRP